jgi:hypothetical protein
MEPVTHLDTETVTAPEHPTRVDPLAGAVLATASGWRADRNIAAAPRAPPRPAPEARARAISSQFPNVAGFETIPRGKLFIQEEFPDQLAALTLDALSRLYPGRRKALAVAAEPEGGHVEGAPGLRAIE